MLDLRSLRHLVVLARHLNYVRAAEELGITQPTLSRSIQALERHLGVRLFDRDRGGVSLTPQGRAISERAGFLLADAADLEQHSRLSAAGQAGRLRFGMTPMPARALLPALLSERLREAPLVTNEVVVRDVEALWTMLTSGEIEFFVGSEAPPSDRSPLRTELLGRFPLSLIVRAGHPLLGRGGGERRFPLVRSSWAGLSIPDAFQLHVLGAANIIEDFAALASATAMTDALWLSTAFAVQTEIRDGRLVEFVRAKERIDVVTYSLARRSLTPLARVACASLHRQVRVLVKSGNE
jgi:DNA-binding transcriptional LysR family regulator